MEAHMVVVRDIFRVKFGQAGEATKLWKRGAALLKQSGFGVKDVRLLTDFAGPHFYTLVLESTFDSVAEWEKAHNAAKSNAEWRDVYQRIVPLMDEGRREMLSVVE